MIVNVAEINFCVPRTRWKSGGILMWLKANPTKETFLKGQVEYKDTEKAESEKVVAKVCEESEQYMERLNVELTGQDRAERLIRS